MCAIFKGKDNQWVPTIRRSNLEIIEDFNAVNVVMNSKVKENKLKMNENIGNISREIENLKKYKKYNLWNLKITEWA